VSPTLTCFKTLFLTFPIINRAAKEVVIVLNQNYIHEAIRKAETQAELAAVRFRTFSRLISEDLGRSRDIRHWMIQKALSTGNC
jgi:hypothetical protein